MRQSKTGRAKKYVAPPDPDPAELEELKFAAASKLCTWREHGAGGGSYYVYVEGLKLRFADHENTSTQYDEPDYNFVNRLPTKEEIKEIGDKFKYPRLCKQLAFGYHLGLSLQKMKTLLTPDCYEKICTDPRYPNTLTLFVRIAPALKILKSLGHTKRVPVRQETVGIEDYCGR